MNYILSVYSREAFREFILPSIRDADYELILRRDVFGLSSDVTLRLEVLGDNWRLNPSANYRLLQNQNEEIRGAAALPFKGMLRLVSRDGEMLSIFSGVSRSPLKAFEKYDIRNLERITVGKDPDNIIRIEGQTTVSGHHAVLHREGNVWYVECPGLNGLYLDGKILKGAQALSFGSVLNIIGLRMVWLGDCLAVDADRPGVSVNGNYLRPITSDAGETGGGLKNAGAAGSGKGTPGSARGAETDAEPGIIYHRSPRDTGRIQSGTISIEAPPPLSGTKEKPFLVLISPALLMLIPMLLGCVVILCAVLARESDLSKAAFFTGIGIVGGSALVMILWAAGILHARKKENRKEELQRYETYSAYLIRKTGEIRSIYEANAAALRSAYPDAASCAGRDASSPSLWNCSSRAEDFLKVRLGTGTMDFQVEIRVPEKSFGAEGEAPTENPAMIRENFRKLYDVPVLADLLRHPVIGLVGGAGKKGAYEAARIISAQLAATHCYTDVKLGYLYDRNAAEDAGQWEFARWLPHVWSGDRHLRYVASDRESLSEVCYELARIFRGRVEKEEKADGKLPKPWYVIFISDVSLIEDEMLSRFLFDPTPEMGLTVVILSDTLDHLPMACEYIIENDDKFCGLYSVARRREEMTAVAFDRLESRELEHFARHLSSIRVQETERGGEIPSQLSFFDMYGISAPEELQAEERWLKNRTSDSIRALIGRKAGGVPCQLDMHEKYHGPHALLAGTTGSGKSALLETCILSLAVNYSPEDVSFFIIDYKGGGMARLFEGLPHLTGQISNLSGSQVHRAMVSVKSENRRRQRIFNRYGVSHIDQYTRLRKNGEAPEPIPHLFIIIDEFAELKKEEPEFMKELISVAQVGRSLGVHLILATQKPEGTVDENIRSNSKARLCLRVESTEDSMDMLHKPDAAYLTRAGRCYLQVGSDEVYELFQAGWSGAPWDGSSGAAGKDAVRLLDITGRTDMAAQGAKRDGQADLSGRVRTQLDAVKEYLIKTAAERGTRKCHPLWLPILPEKLSLDGLGDFKERRFDGQNWKTPEEGRTGEEETKGAGRGRGVRTAVGLMDDPENQIQEPLYLSFPGGGHTAVYGGPGSGRSTFVETALYGLINLYTPDRLQAYILDFGGGSLSAFEGAPHVGGVIGEDDGEKIARLFHMLTRLLEERKKAARRRSGEEAASKQEAAGRDAVILLVIDQIASFREKTGDAYEKLLELLAREGSRHGICLFVTAGGIGSGGLPGRIAENIRTAVCLELPERYLYGELLRSRGIGALPEAGVKGRGLAMSGADVLEFQTALSDTEADDYQRLEETAALCRRMAEAWDGPAAREIPAIPERPDYETFAAAGETGEAAADPAYLPVGYDAGTAEIFSIDLRDVFCWLITGAARTGKTNFMRVMLASAVRKGAECAVFDPDGDMGFAGKCDRVRMLTTEDELFRYCVDTLSPEFKKRNEAKRSLEMAGGSEEELFELAAGETPVFIFLPDLEKFIRTVYGNTRGMSGFMETIFRRGRFHNIYFAAVLPPEGRTALAGYKAFELFVSYGTGIHFGGNPAKEPVLPFDHLSYSDRTRVLKAGIGLLPDSDGEERPDRIVVPLASFRFSEQE